MTTTPRLALRGQTYYFRMALPCDLAALFERREIRRSLRTSDRTLATIRCRAISNTVDLLCREARMMLEKQNDAVDEQVRAYFRRELDSGVDFAEVFAPEPEVDLDSEIESIKRRMKDYKRLLSRQGCASHLQDAAGKIVNTIPPEILKSRHDALLRAQRNLMRAEIEADRILVAKLQGEYSDTKVLDPLFEGVEASAEPPPLAFPNLNFDPVSNAAAAPIASSAASIEALAGEYFESLRIKGTAEKTMGDHRLTMELARAVIAFDKPVTELVTSDVKALRDLIGRLPAHAAKNPLTRDLPLLEAVEVGKDMPRLGFKTQKKRLDFFKNFLRWLVAEEHLGDVPGEKIVVNAVKSKEAARHPYEMSALHTIFHSPIWTGRKNHLHVTKPGTLKTRDSRFWIPLIALLSGMRAGEILQLLRSDIRCEDDVWFFDVSKGEGEDDKKLKTGTSWRRVPVHRALLDLGFIASVQKVKTGRIFADQSMGSDGTYSQLWSKFWGRYARKCGFYTPKHVFHSFRHNFVDALHDAGVPDSIANQLCGHSDKSAHAGYGKGASLKRLKEEIDRIEYPGLDLAHLQGKSWK